MKRQIPLQRITLVFPAAAAGALAPLSFSPLDVWPAGMLSALGLFLLLEKPDPRRAAVAGWYFGLGFFGLGASWIYVSINVYGNAGPLLAGFLTALWVAGLALFFSLQAWLYRRYLNWNSTHVASSASESAGQPAIGRVENYQAALAFTALWVLFEWLRGWVLTGFPWLYLGYAHIHTPLAGLAPVLGVMGISFAAVLTPMLLLQLCRHYLYVGFVPRDSRHLITLGFIALWALPAQMERIDWVRPRPGPAVPVGLVQANIDQNLKFDRDFLQDSLDTYGRLSQPLWDNTLVLWPETAIPLLYQQAGGVLDYFSAQAAEHGSALVTGILFRDNGVIHNSIVSMGNGEGIYHKRKLVPFGEYVPLEGLVGGLLRIFDLPMSSLRPGPAGQDLLKVNGLALAPYICYEVVYPDFVRRSARQADFLVTISNDTWFGASWGPLQHLQMAAMRALENGRYLVRATNNGVSAIIDEKGNILQRTAQFRAEVLAGEVRLFDGVTPFSRWGSWPVIILSVLILGASALPWSHGFQRSNTQDWPSGT